MFAPLRASPCSFTSRMCCGARDGHAVEANHDKSQVSGLGPCAASMACIFDARNSGNGSSGGSSSHRPWRSNGATRPAGK